MEDKDLQTAQSFTGVVQQLAEDYGLDCIVLAGKTSEAKGTYMMSFDHTNNLYSILMLQRILNIRIDNLIKRIFNPSKHSEEQDL